MSNNLTPQQPNDEDDGYGGSLTPSQSVRNYARWTDTAGWFDRDGLPLPAAMLVPAVNTGLQKWKNNVADFIWDKPLPDPQQLNSQIPKTEWEKGLSGEARPPWERIIAVILVDPATGAVYRYTSSTVGARIAYDALREATITIRMLRGQKVIPLVDLSERPFKTNFGMKKRPHFQIVGWKSPGGEDDKAIATKPAPQLSGPATTAAPQTESTAPAAAPASAPETATPYQAKPKPPLNLAGETLNTMGDAKPATVGEILDDSVPW
jgi:hypothetical protein